MGPFLAEAEQQEWNSLAEQARDAERVLRENRNRRSEILSAAVGRTLIQGLWEIDEGGAITPRPNLEDDLCERLSMAFGLGYHDSFRIESDGFFISGRVDDGAVTLHAFVYPKSNGTEADPATLSFPGLDLRHWIGRLLRGALKREEMNKVSLERRIKNIQQNLAVLECPDELAGEEE